MESDAVTAEWAIDYGHKLRQWQDYETPVFDMSSQKWFKLEQNYTKIETDVPGTLLF